LGQGVEEGERKEGRRKRSCMKELLVSEAIEYTESTGQWSERFGNWSREVQPATWGREVWADR